ncbi:MAG: hypothetical protein NVSMB57_14610 [Actinomycetota bacterium]
MKLRSAAAVVLVLSAPGCGASRDAVSLRAAALRDLKARVAVVHNDVLRRDVNAARGDLVALSQAVKSWQSRGMLDSTKALAIMKAAGDVSLALSSPAPVVRSAAPSPRPSRVRKHKQKKHKDNNGGGEGD